MASPSRLQKPVLVLNASYEPINVCAARRALVLVLKGVASAEEVTPHAVHSTRRAVAQVSLLLAESKSAGIRQKRLDRRAGIEPGSRLELRIGIFSWIALHTVYEKNRLFVDQQIRGPFANWIHRHEFESTGNGTRL